MPYIPWVSSEPLGSAQANTIDDIIRQLKAQIEERMNTILDPTGQWDDDPIKLSPTGTLRTGLQVMVGPFEASALNATLAIGVNQEFVQVGTPFNFYVNVPAQKGWKITKVEALIDTNGTTVVWSMKRHTFSTTPASTQIGSGSASGGPVIAIVSPFTGNETVNNTYYTVEFDGSGAWNFYGLRVSYDEVAI